MCIKFKQVYDMSFAILINIKIYLLIQRGKLI